MTNEKKFLKFTVRLGMVSIAAFIFAIVRPTALP